MNSEKEEKILQPCGKRHTGILAKQQ